MHIEYEWYLIGKDHEIVFCKTITKQVVVGEKHVALVHSLDRS